MVELESRTSQFQSRPVFHTVRGGSAEIPPNWLIVVHGKGNKYRLIPMNSQVRDTLFGCGRPSDEFVLTGTSTR